MEKRRGEIVSALNLPEGVLLTRREGAGEVQTPLVVDSGTRLQIGDPVLFRHAKTYRGEGKSFL